MFVTLLPAGHGFEAAAFAAFGSAAFFFLNKPPRLDIVFIACVVVFAAVFAAVDEVCCAAMEFAVLAISEALADGLHGAAPFAAFTCASITAPCPDVSCTGTP